MIMKSILESIEQRLILEGFKKILDAPELRKYVWENPHTCVICTILFNHPMTVMNIEEQAP